MTKTRGYLSYLLRMWQTRDGETDTWHASLEQPGSRERQGFATLEELFEFLRIQTTSQPELGRKAANGRGDAKEIGGER